MSGAADEPGGDEPGDAGDAGEPGEPGEPHYRDFPWISSSLGRTSTR